jgi:transposase
MGAVRVLGRQLARDGIEIVTLESASDYWRIWFFVLEACGLAVQLVNAAQARNLPGRPKTDKLDAQWLARLTEMGLLRASFVPPKAIRDLRDYTRARTRLVHERTRCWQRLEKLLESALVKVSSVASKLTTLSAQDMIKAMIAGQRDPKVLAGLARGRARVKMRQLEQALEGAEFFTPELAALLQAMLARIDRIDAEIAALTAVIERLLAPYEEQLQQAESMPGWARLAAQDAIAETGPDMTRFPTPAHLASWAGRTPVDRQSGSRKGKATAKKGNRYLGAVTGQTAVAAGKTQTREGVRHRRLVRRRGKAKACVATGNTQMRVYHVLLSNPGMRYEDLGWDYYERERNTARQVAHHIGKLASLGYEVTLCKQPDPGEDTPAT